MKVPEPQKLPSGNYYIRLRFKGEDPINITAPTAKACRSQAALIKAEHLAGKRTAMVRTDITLHDAVREYITLNEQALSPSTIKGYNDYLKYRFPNYMNKPLKSISWQQMINEELKTKSPKTVKNAWALVAPAIAEHGYKPKVALAKVAKKPPVFLTSAQAKQFVALVKDTDIAIPALLALHGLRRSEIYALEWSQINLGSRDIFVHGAVVFGKDNKPIRKGTNKNASSVRHVPIMIPELLDAMQAVEHKEGRVVTIMPNSLWRSINKVCEENGLPLVGVHGLRHSLASLGVRVGMTEDDLMQIGGWADSRTMHEIYVHVAAAELAEKSNKIMSFFANADENADAAEKV